MHARAPWSLYDARQPPCALCSPLQLACMSSLELLVRLVQALPPLGQARCSVVAAGAGKSQLLQTEPAPSCLLPPHSGAGRRPNRAAEETAAAERERGERSKRQTQSSDPPLSPRLSRDTSTSAAAAGEAQEIIN
ncbi:hypothetical protein NDU88_003010 [Pleurodeles waltl]|uniref:Uncharacterized protein n=1 Tax=Pleurodeles waltl TaxID=8319 RepID=A0AAV7UX99_PLEWA|nr:hypothetical protein NDU88_003010 [Pleurodeles waltl]